MTDNNSDTTVTDNNSDTTVTDNNSDTTVTDNNSDTTVTKDVPSCSVRWCLQSGLSSGGQSSPLGAD